MPADARPDLDEVLSLNAERLVHVVFAADPQDVAPLGRVPLQRFQRRVRGLLEAQALAGKVPDLDEVLAEAVDLDRVELCMAEDNVDGALAVIFGGGA